MSQQYHLLTTILLLDIYPRETRVHTHTVNKYSQQLEETTQITHQADEWVKYIALQCPII